jgi:S1-C subfamily serine protease
MRTAVVAVLCALLGGAAGGGLVLALDDDEGTTGRATGGERAAAPQQRPVAPDGELTPADIYRRDAPGVVFIRAPVVQRSQSPFDVFPQEQRGESTGTGFVIDDGGEILTNAHVVQDATAVQVRFADGKVARARLRGIDPSTDLALLRVDPEGLGLKPLELGTSRDVKVGDPTVAIGNPFGLDLTLTTGVVSAKARRIEAPNGFQIEDVLQTDAAINPGNSGGPLIDGQGRVIGINSAIRTGGEGGGNIGIGFAVPVDTAKRILPQLRRSGRVSRPFLGVTAASVEDDGGAFVQDVLPGGPADEAGVRPGDVIVSIAGERVRTAEDVPRIVEEREPGERVRIEVTRGEARATLEAELADRAEALGGGTVGP